VGINSRFANGEGKFHQFFSKISVEDKEKRRRSVISSKVYALHESGNGGISRIIARIRTVGIYKRAGCFDRFSFSFLPFHILRVSASSFFPSFLSRSRLLYYFVTALRGCLFFSFLYFYFFPNLRAHPLRFFPLFAPCFFFSSSLLTAQRGIRTLDFSTTKLENKRRNVSH